ncbi:MAG: hypothetical protein AAF637_07310 [Pseudomonadota bacterium]
MTAQSATLNGAVPDRSPLGWLIVLPLGILVLGQILLVWTGTIPVLDGMLVDPDGYMRLNRVIELYESGAWFDSRYWRINPPEGHVQHWTRPLDAVLLAGAWVLEPFLGFRQGLHLWGVLISPVFLALSVIALAWATESVLDRDSRLLACLAFLIQPTILAYSSVGRPDHHSALLLLFVILMGLTFRMLTEPLDRRSAKLAGAVAALGLWISLESLTFIGCSMAILGLFWLLGDSRLAIQSRNYLLTMSFCLAGALVVERGPFEPFAVETDRLSILHLALFLLIALFWMFSVRFERPESVWQERMARIAVYLRRPFALPEPPSPQSAGLLGRLVFAGSALASVGLAMLVLFPELNRGPLGEVDPLYDDLRLQRIVEVQPLVSPELLFSLRLGEIGNRVIQVVGIALFAVPFLMVLLARRDGVGHRIWAAVALALALFLPLTFYQVRWSGYAQTLLVIPYSAFVAWLLLWIAEHLPAVRLQFVRPLIIVIALFWPIGIAQLMPEDRIVTASDACPIGRLSPTLDQIGPPGTILALADHGPELLYRTRHQVLSIPNHRPQPGFSATHDVLTTTDPQVASAELARHDVRWILLCPSLVEDGYFVDGREGQPTLYHRLLDGTAPSWLRPVPLADDLGENLRLFAFEPRPAFAGGAAVLGWR